MEHVHRVDVLQRTRQLHEPRVDARRGQQPHRPRLLLGRAAATPTAIPTAPAAAAAAAAAGSLLVRRGVAPRLAPDAACPGAPVARGAEVRLRRADHLGEGGGGGK